MTADRVFETTLGVGLVILGVLLDRVVIAVRHRAAAKHVKELLARELKDNISRLIELDKTLKAYPGSLGLSQIGERIGGACVRESFDACRGDLPSLGKDGMDRVFAFYDQARSVSFSFREIETWQGNIRSTLIDDHLEHLLRLAWDAIRAVE